MKTAGGDAAGNLSHRCRVAIRGDQDDGGAGFVARQRQQDERPGQRRQASARHSKAVPPRPRLSGSLKSSASSSAPVTLALASNSMLTIWSRASRTAGGRLGSRSASGYALMVTGSKKGVDSRHRSWGIVRATRPPRCQADGGRGDGFRAADDQRSVGARIGAGETGARSHAGRGRQTSTRPAGRTWARYRHHNASRLTPNGPTQPATRHAGPPPENVTPISIMTALPACSSFTASTHHQWPRGRQSRQCGVACCAVDAVEDEFFGGHD